MILKLGNISNMHCNIIHLYFRHTGAYTANNFYLLCDQASNIL